MILSGIGAVFFMAVITNRDPSRFHENNPHVPTGFSYQTGRVHKSWREMNDHIKRTGDQKGEDRSLEREDDYAKMRGTRYFRHCESVQVKYSTCKHCGEPVC